MAHCGELPKAVLYPLLGAVLRGLLWLYQACISPFLGAQCRHLPSCSQYAKDALSLYGPLRGSWYTLKRILRCHPWATPVFDPVPPVRSGDDQTNANRHTSSECHSNECCGTR